MELDSIFMDLVKGGGVSGSLIAIALVYLALQVRSLNTTVSELRKLIVDTLIPRIDAHDRHISDLQGRSEMWEVMRRKDG